MAKMRILLKLTGEIFLDQKQKSLSNVMIQKVIDQIKQLHATHHFGIVVGGGNFFRGDQHGTALGVGGSTGHQIGMLATMMNGLILHDLLIQKGLPTSLLCALSIPEIGKSISTQTIDDALAKNQIMIFTGGTGNPYFTTDTNAVLRALQISADQIWKGTTIDGIYDADPRINAHAKQLKSVSFENALNNTLGIMDTTAYALAQKYKQTIRVFNIFTENALLLAAKNKTFGSILT